MSAGKAAASAPASSYQENLAWLYSLQRFGIKLGLETAHRLIAELGLDFTQPCVIHVAGTNGKGSVCAMIDAICRAARYRTGLFTSPHLVTFRERVRINGEMISQEAAATGLKELRELTATWDFHPTFFEITTALALQYFVREKADVVILETGLGGRLDATNAVPANVAVITPIALDHQKWLGSTLREIAGEKAGIIQGRVPVVSAPQSQEAQLIIEERARACDAPLRVVQESYGSSPIALKGAHQKWNAAVAVGAIASAGLDVRDTAVADGLASVEWPARFQRWDERIVIDGAHNPAAASVLADAWKETFGEEQATVILAVLDDKDVSGILETLESFAGELLLPHIRGERALPPERLAAMASSATPSLLCSVVRSFPEALDRARVTPRPILITGSLHFAGEALAHLRGEPAAFEECAQ